MFAAAPAMPFPFRTTTETLLGLGPLFSAPAPFSARAVAFVGASMSGCWNSLTADWMFDGSVRSSLQSRSAPRLTWKKFPDGKP